MKSHNAENERIKRRYFAYLKEAKRRRGQPFHAVLLKWAANARKRAMRKIGQMELFA